MSEFRRRLLIQQKQSENDIKYPGLIAAWSAEGKSNTDSDRGILKDLTGNGYDLTLHNFKFDGNDGYNSFGTSLNNWLFYGDNSIYQTIKQNNKYVSSIGRYLGYIIYTSKENSGNDIIKFKIFGLKNAYKIVLCSGPNIGDSFYHDGIYTFQLRDFFNRYPKSRDIGIKIFLKDDNPRDSSLTPLETNDKVSIEFLPVYSNSLTFNGKLEYGVNKNMPILNDYTVICKRIIRNIYNASVISKGGNGAFCFETDRNTWFNGAVYRVQYPELISWQTVNTYNQKTFGQGTNKNTNTIHLGLVRDNDQRATNMIFYSAYLFDRSLPPEEIKAFIKKYIDEDYLLPNEVPHPSVYYDFTQKTNISENKEIAEDLSGNNNNNLLVNFKFDATSGYINYPINFYNWKKRNDALNKVVINSNNKITINKRIQYPWDFYRIFYTPFNQTLKIKVNQECFFIKDLKYRNSENLINTLTIQNIKLLPNVINEIQLKNSLEYLPNNSKFDHDLLFFNSNDLTEPLIIEILPNESGALFFNGIDNYIQLNTINKGFKTTFMLCHPLKTNTILYDQRIANENSYGIFNDAILTAYKGRNPNSTYINNKVNTTLLGNELLNRTHLITIKTNNVVNTKPIIGINFYYDKTFAANMYLYKFLGFNEELNQKQINYVINKYNLMNNIDEI